MTANGIVYIQSVGSNTTTATTVDVTPVANTAAGNTIVVAVTASSARNIAGVSDSQGNVYSIDANSPANARTGGIAHGYLDRPLTTSDTITVTLSGSGVVSVAAYEFSGIVKQDALDKKNVTQGSAVTSLASGSTGLLSQANEMVFTISGNALPAIYVAPTGFTEVLPTNVASELDAAYKLVQVTTELNPTWNWDTSANATVAIATYKAAPSPLLTGDDLTNSMNAVQYSNVNGDDGDYFIQYGSRFLVQNYKYKWTNNTDIPSFTWRGRSTVDTRSSPILVQIYNVQLVVWETLATINTVPVDTDFSTSVSKATNISNYYDSNNVVAFRIYQLVV
jgi:hypothetical protein